MGHHVRAKFRCLSILTRYDGTIVAELKPVQQKGSNSKENAEFWSYSPNGEAQLVFHKKHTIEVGSYYYIDMLDEQHEEGLELWKLDSIGRHSEGAAEVYLSGYKAYDHDKKPEGRIGGYLKMWMEPKAQGAIASFSSPGSKWSVSFTFAEPSDSEP